MAGRTMGTATTAKQILIADPSETSRRDLLRFFRTKGYKFIETGDGSRALAETLLKKPHILLLDLSLPGLGPDRLVQILRPNPTTKNIPIFFLSEQEKSVPGFRPGIDEFIRKPFHSDEVLLRIQRTLFQDNITESFAGDSEISGNLAQIFLPDLWQILSMNKKSGVVQVEGEGTGGSIYIDQGEIVSARAQNTLGEKALYRLISLREGRFRFQRGIGGGARGAPSRGVLQLREGHREQLQLPRPRRLRDPARAEEAGDIADRPVRGSPNEKRIPPAGGNGPAAHLPRRYGKLLGERRRAHRFFPPGPRASRGGRPRPGTAPGVPGGLRLFLPAEGGGPPDRDGRETHDRRGVPSSSLRLSVPSLHFSPVVCPGSPPPGRLGISPGRGL